MTLMNLEINYFQVCFQTQLRMLNVTFKHCWHQVTEGPGGVKVLKQISHGIPSYTWMVSWVLLLSLYCGVGGQSVQVGHPMGPNLANPRCHLCL